MARNFSPILKRRWPSRHYLVKQASPTCIESIESSSSVMATITANTFEKCLQIKRWYSLISFTLIGLLSAFIGISPLHLSGWISSTRRLAWMDRWP
jgi:hypothetical protein